MGSAVRIRVLSERAEDSDYLARVPGNLNWVCRLPHNTFSFCTFTYKSISCKKKICRFTFLTFSF